MKTLIFFTLLILLMAPGSMAQQRVADFDGHLYDTIHIGTLVWLTPNLRTTHYSNGVPVPMITDSVLWAHTNSGARCYYDNDSAMYDSVYGALYNYFVITDTNKICPTGWRVPTNNEWLATEVDVGGLDIAGGEMKEAGTAHWMSPNVGATNHSGFTGLPGGAMDPYTSTYTWLRENGLWWTATSYSGSMAWSTYMWYMSTSVDHNPVSKKAGMSIRCVQDIDAGVNGLAPEGDLWLYPDPVVDLLTVITRGSGTARLEIYDVTGRLVLDLTMTGPQTLIDCSAFPPGLYVVKAIQHGQVAIQKMIRK